MGVRFIPPSFYPPVQLVVCLFGLRFPHTFSGGFLLSLLLGLKGKWILTWHTRSFFGKNKIKTRHIALPIVIMNTNFYFCKQNEHTMAPIDYAQILTQAVEELSDSRSYEGLYQQHKEGDPLPSSQSLQRIVELARSILFPGYFGNSTVHKHTIPYHIGVNVECLFNLLTEQIHAGFCFGQENNGLKINPDRETAALLATQFISKLPNIRRILATDVEAAYYGDPAATCFGEIISCYPAIRAISNYRIAHELLVLGVPLIPRILTEMAHSETGIDIHPGARIGHHFTIDHGTGVVIGATCIIGNHVKLYQGVTLGAKSFPLDNEGNPIKGIPRHPILEDEVIVYSNATILGRVTIGKGATIGGNIWVTENVPPGTRIVQQKR